MERDELQASVTELQRQVDALRAEVDGLRGITIILAAQRDNCENTKQQREGELRAEIGRLNEVIAGLQATAIDRWVRRIIFNEGSMQTMAT